MESRDQFLLVLGEAGAGKSTFINDLTKRQLCHVSAKRNEDGTSAVGGPYMCSNGLKAFDTVGLNSKNYDTSIRGLLSALRKVNASDVAVLLVCKTSTTRFTTWIDHFKSTVTQLFVGRTLNVIIYWVCDLGHPTTELEEEIREALGPGFSCAFMQDSSRSFESFDRSVLSVASGNLNRLNGLNYENAVAVTKISTDTADAFTIATEKVVEERSLFSLVQPLLGKVVSSDQNEKCRNALIHCSHLSSEELIAAKFNGDNLLLFTLTCQFQHLTEDIEASVKNALSTSNLAMVYDHFVSDRPELLISGPNNVCKRNIVAATAWFLYKDVKVAKQKNNPFLFFINVLMNIEERKLKPYKSVGQPVVLAIPGVAVGEPGNGWTIDTGAFESFINENSTSSQQKRDIKDIVIIVNDVAQKHAALKHAQKAGSVFKHTNVEKVSDVDIICYCKETIDEVVRKQVCRTILLEVKQNEKFRNTSMAYRSNATTYRNSAISFDVLFDKNSFSEDVSEPPKSDELYDRPDLQRAIKAFKILIREIPSAFTKTKGIKIEAFVIEVSKGLGVLNDSSGGKLFLACLQALSRTEKSIAGLPKLWETSATAIFRGKEFGCTVLNQIGLRKFVE